MGGLSKKTPTTFITFLLGTLALTGMPGLAGFFSKEEILGAAYPHGEHGCGWCFWVALFTALLTAFYMTRCVVVAFFGKARSHEAEEAHEGPWQITLPLMILAVFAVGAGYHLFSDRLLALRPEGHHGEGMALVMTLSIAAIALGTAAAFFLYKGKESEPLKGPLIRAFANRFYIDPFYDKLVLWFQDRVAWIVSGLDVVFSDGLVARLPAALARQGGHIARKVQSGQLQGYTFALGAGLLLVIYLAVFR